MCWRGTKKKSHSIHNQISGGASVLVWLFKLPLVHLVVFMLRASSRLWAHREESFDSSASSVSCIDKWTFWGVSGQEISSSRADALLKLQIQKTDNKTFIWTEAEPTKKTTTPQVIKMVSFLDIVFITVCSPRSAFKQDFNPWPVVSDVPVALQVYSPIVNNHQIFTNRITSNSSNTSRSVDIWSEAPCFSLLLMY